MNGLKSGDKIKTMDGTTVEAPYANEHPCFGQRQGWCQNLSTWRIEGKRLMLHWRDRCKDKLDSEHKFDTVGEFEWTKLEARL